MADLLRIVSFSNGGRPVVEADIENGTTFRKVRDSLKITAPAKKPVLSSAGRRYGGSRQVGETTDNGELKATWIVSGATADVCLQNLGTLLVLCERATPGLFLEFRPDGATRSTFYELRGTASWDPDYKWAQFAGAMSLNVEIAFPVAPLGYLPRMDIADDFAVDSLSDYTFDAGGGTMVVANGQLAPTSTSEKRFWYSARGFRYRDAQVTLKITTGAVANPAAGVGLALRRLDSNNNLLMSMIASTSAIVIYKFDGGVYTSLASVAVPALAANTSYWLRARAEGNLLIAEWFTAVPTPTSTPAATVSYTLAGADATKFGAGVAGDVGIRTDAIPTDWRYDDFQVEPYTYRNRTLPETIVLGGSIPGDAPALVDVHITPTGGTSPPVWAMVGWAKRPTAPIAGVAPFGIIQAETGTDLVTFAVAADANYRGGNGLKATASGAGTATAMFAIDPSTLAADDFTLQELDIEIWARLDLASALVSPKIVLSARPDAGTSFGAERFTGEFGSVGKLLGKPSSGSAFRIVRLGSLPLVADPAERVVWKLRVAASWAAGSSGTFGLDELLLVAARKRAAGPTGKANDATYPKFVASTAETRKVIRTDLSGRVASGAGPLFPDSGLGGSVLELAPGNNDLLVKLSSTVPDDPTSNTASEQKEHTATVHLAVQPRVTLLRGS